MKKTISTLLVAVSLLASLLSVSGASQDKNSLNAAQARSQSTGTEDVPSRLRTLTAARRNTALVVQCTSGETWAFGNRDVQSVSNQTVTVKKRSLVARVKGDPANALERKSVAELLQLIVADPVEDLLLFNISGGSPITALQLEGSVGLMKAPESCEVRDILAPLWPIEEFDEPVVLHQLGAGGQVVGVIVYEYAKPKSKEKPETCIVRVADLPPHARAMAPEIDTAFRDELMSHLKRQFKNVLLDGGDSTATGHLLEIMPLGMATDSRFSSLALPYDQTAQVAYRVTDRSTGRTLLLGRAVRLIGHRHEKDARDLASFVRCN